jgi:hypothetical protein
MKKLLPGQKLDQVEICVTKKSLNLTDSGAAQLKESSNDIRSRLGAELRHNGTNLGSFECN